MLTADRVKPHLLNPERHVRRQAWEYFGESWSCDPDLVPLAVQCCEGYGVEDSLDTLFFCQRFPLTAEALDQALALLARTDHESAVGHLNRVIAGAPLELLAAREQAIADNPHFDRALAPLLARRREWAGRSGEQLWQELQDFARGLEGKYDVEEVDHDHADALVAALAGHDVPDPETIARLLRSPEVEESWLEIFLIDLAGERRLRELVPTLVEKFHVDTDYMLEQCMDALAKIGDPEAARLIRAGFPTGPEQFRLYTADVLGRIKSEESEDALLAVLPGEKDCTFRTALCVSLCKLFSERGIAAVLREVERGYDSTLADLEDDVLRIADVLGVTLPLGEVWRQRREARDRSVARRTAELTEAMKHFRAPEPAPLPEPESAPPALSVPFRAAPRTGRNEPCPCGSGKKFKNCCLRKNG
jgi:hypothetical protein